MDVISARRNADMTIQTLRQCRSEERFNRVWQIASAMGLKMKQLRESYGKKLHKTVAYINEHNITQLMKVVPDH